MDNQLGTKSTQPPDALLKAQSIALEIRRSLDVLPQAGEEDLRVIRAQSRLDELADVMLDLPEPKRTEVFQIYHGLRKMVDDIVRRQQS